MDDLYSDDFEGVLDHDNHRDLELELGNNYHDGPFGVLPNIDPRPDFYLAAHYDYDVEYHGDSENDADLGGISFDERSVSSESIGSPEPYHPYESSEPRSSSSSSAAGSSISDDLEQEFRVHFHDLEEPFSDGNSHQSDESDEAQSLPLSEGERIQNHSDHGGISDSEADSRVDDYRDFEEEEIHRHIDPWDAHEGEVDPLSDDEILEHFAAGFSEIDDFSDNSELDNFDEDGLPHNNYPGEESESERQNSDSGSEEESQRSQLYSSGDEGSASSDSNHSLRSSSFSSSRSEGSLPPIRHHLGEFLNDYPREFDEIRQEIDQLHEQRQRLQEDLRQLRGEGPFWLPDPDRRANAPNGVDHFLDHLPAPQRDAHGLLARMEMDLEIGRQRRRAAPAQSRAPPRPGQQREPAYIDLTGDSDSPPREVLTLPDAPRFSARRSRSRDPNPFAPRDQNRNNQRRENQVRRAPSRDGNFLVPGGAPVIDLTDDAAEAVLPRLVPPPPRVLPPPRRQRDQANSPAPAARGRDRDWPHNPGMDAFFRQVRIANLGAVDFIHRMHVAVMGGGEGDYEVEFIGENRRPGHDHGVMENPLADNPVEFNYGANGLNQEPARPKPVHIEPPEPRKGFTRSTGEDTVVVCPSCEEELKYDPADGEAQPPPAKKARHTRKDREEHHFWAVKACGHVYCRSCFENRRPTAKNVNKTAFPLVDRKVLCAVEDCTSDVSAKTAWVGIFL